MRPGYILILFILFFTSAFSQRKLTVYADKPVASVSPTMWGMFFEDINYGADGGLYAELVKNRSFEFFQTLMGWNQYKNDGFSNNSEAGKTLVISRGLGLVNPRFARVEVKADHGYGLANHG